MRAMALLLAAGVEGVRNELEGWKRKMAVDSV